MLGHEIEFAIIQKAKDLNINPKKHLDEVVKITNTLRSFINQDISLDNNEIEKLIERLTVFTTLVSVPIENGIHISRAVKFDDDSINPCYPNVSRLSYIPKDISITPPLGRMNKEDNAMFYGSLYSHSNSMGTILSEVRAVKNEKFNILFSETTNDLELVPIGVFDYFRRGVPHPFRLHNDFKEMYDLYQNNTHPTAMLALQLCDAFLSDILTMDESDNLYSVTSTLASECLKVDVIDGLMYPSVKFEDFPNVVIKPNSIDKKTIHKEVHSLIVNDSFGYGMYETETLFKGNVNTHDGIINWSKTK